MTTHSNDGLLDLLLLGLTWVQEETGTPTGWTGNGILQTMRQVGVLTDGQYTYLARGNRRFGEFLEPHTHSVGGDASAATMRAACLATPKLLVAAVTTPQISGEMLFTPKGYKLAASEQGQRRALQVASKYAPYLTRDVFRGQWGSHRRQMSGMHATSRRSRTGVEG